MHFATGLIGHAFLFAAHKPPIVHIQENADTTFADEQIPAWIVCL